MSVSTSSLKELKLSSNVITSVTKATVQNEGTVQLGFSGGGSKYEVQEEQEEGTNKGKIYVNVPWTDTSVDISYDNGYSNALTSLKNENNKNTIALNISTLSSELSCVDRAFVNSSIATQTAHFVGTYGDVSCLYELSSDATVSSWLGLNDYGYVYLSNDTDKKFNRYKVNDIKRDSLSVISSLTWLFEYTLNNSSFTSDQWKALNSGATEENIKSIATKITLDDVGDYTLSTLEGSEPEAEQKTKALRDSRLVRLRLSFEGQEKFQYVYCIDATDAGK